MRLLCLIFIFVPLISLRAQSVKTRAEKGVDLNAYTTFRVDKGELVTVSEQPVDEDAFYTNIDEAVIRELSGKGYRMVKDSTADLVISYVAQSVMKMDVEKLGPLGQQPVNDPSQVDASRNWAREYGEGSLMIDVYAGKKKVWQATGTVEMASISDKAVINAIVYKSFKKFPKKK